MAESGLGREDPRGLTRGSSERALFLLAAILAACATSQRGTSDDGRAAGTLLREPDLPAFVVDAERELRWVGAAAGTLSAEEWRLSEAIEQDPHGDAVQWASLLVGADGAVTLRLIPLREHAEAVDVPLPALVRFPTGWSAPMPPSSAIGRATAVGFGDRGDVHVFVMSAAGGWSGRLSLGEQRWVDSRWWRDDLEQLQAVRWLGRVRDAWVAVGHEPRGGSLRGDLLGWWASDDAPSWPSPQTLAKTHSEHQFGFVDGRSSWGSAMVLGQTADEDGRGVVRGFVAIDGAFAPLPPLSGHPNITPGDAFFLEALDDAVEPAAMLVQTAPVRADRLAIDPSDQRVRAKSMTFGNRVFIWGGSDGHVNGRPVERGTLCDLDSHACVFVAPPVRPDVDAASWIPELLVEVSGRACVVGGVIWSPRHAEFLGGACLDTRDLSWEWVGLSHAVGTGCRGLGTQGERAVVGCFERGWDDTPDDGHYERSFEQRTGPEQWQIGLLGVVGATSAASR